MSARSRTVSSSAPIKALLIAAALALAAPAEAHRALLIGVGDYAGLDRSLALDAPPEDVARVAGALERAGFARAGITLMTERTGAAPTRAAVLGVLAGLAKDAKPGEQVLVYFSGHGTQAPARVPGREADGLDELYLMADAAGWDGGLGRVPGAIDDVELAAALEAIRATGADVWFVADTCHAGGVFRGGDGKAKGITPARLGIPARPARGGAAPAPAPAPAGRFAAFYAAGPGAEARERRLPLGSPDARPLSQFSYALVRALDGGRLRSLRDLAIAVNAADAALGGDAPQPLFEGALDMGVLGLAADRPRRWTVERGDDGLVVAAGVEEGLAAGQVLTLRDAGGAAVGRATVKAAGFGRTLLAAPDAPDGLLEAESDLPPIDGTRALLDALPALAGAGAAQDMRGTARLWRPGARRDCPALDAAGPPAEQVAALDLMAPAMLGQCDVVIASFRNDGRQAVDASPFYLGADGRLQALSYLEGAGVRVRPGESRAVAVRLLSEDRRGGRLPVGAERLVLLAFPAATGTPADLRGIASPAWRGGGSGAPADPAGAGALVYRWTVAAR